MPSSLSYFFTFGYAKEETVVLSGAGMSAESGLKTFRDSDGLWEGYNIEDVATPQAWRKRSKTRARIL
jgi:NAD-dependent SIR2 family protein deacetylase